MLKNNLFVFRVNELKRHVWLLPILLLSTALSAAEPTPQDFAEGIDITPDDNRALQWIGMPESYYRQSLRRGGGDLRVYNQAGQIVPHKIEQPVDRSEYQQQQPLAYFPVYGRSRTDLDSLSLQIERSADGSLINIESQNQQAIADDQVIAYIIDVSKANAAAEQASLKRLMFEWAEPEYGFINGLQVSASNDLEQWSSVTANQSLSRLDYAGQSLGKSHIDVAAASSSNYLRLSWPSEQPSLQVTAISGGYAWSKLTDGMRQQHLLLPMTFNAESDDTLESGAYRFNTGGQFPLEQLSLVAIQEGQNEYYAGRLYSRADKDKTWTARGRVEQFRLNAEAGMVSSEPQTIDGIRDPHWLIRFEYPQQFPAGGAPAVRLGWRPERLLFLAQGQPPYTLAYGNPNVSPIKTSQSNWLGNLPEGVQAADATASAALGSVYALGGPPVAQETEQQIPWDEVLLWGILITGVLLMFWMASRLYRQMGQGVDAAD